MSGWDLGGLLQQQRREEGLGGEPPVELAVVGAPLTSEVATPKASTVPSSATAYHTVSCVRMVRTSGLHDVADPAHRVDELRPACPGRSSCGAG